MYWKIKIENNKKVVLKQNMALNKKKQKKKSQIVSMHSKRNHKKVVISLIRTKTTVKLKNICKILKRMNFRKKN